MLHEPINTTDTRTPRHLNHRFERLVNGAPHWNLATFFEILSRAVSIIGCEKVSKGHERMAHPHKRKEQLESDHKRLQVHLHPWTAPTSPRIHAHPSPGFLGW